MKTLYFDLSMGAAGDVVNAALYVLLYDNVQKVEYIAPINPLGF